MDTRAGRRRARGIACPQSYPLCSPLYAKGPGESDVITRTLLAATVTAELLLAQSNLLQNGDFENGPPIPATKQEFTVTGAELPGWFIPLGNCDYNSPFWSPSERQSLARPAWRRARSD